MCAGESMISTSNTDTVPSLVFISVKQLLQQNSAENRLIERKKIRY